MAGSTNLDRNLKNKVASALKVKPENVNVRVCKLASKHGISSESALILLAKHLDIGTQIAYRKLNSSRQAEVRDTLPVLFQRLAPKSEQNGSATTKKTSSVKISEKATRSAAVDYLIVDPDLKERCKDLLLAKSAFDRPINQATLVLEDRIRKKALPPTRLTGEKLVNYAFNADLKRTVLKAAETNDEQKGIADLLRGIVLAYRHKTHHHLVSYTREQALTICSFIDVLLDVVDKAEKLR